MNFFMSYRFLIFAAVRKIINVLKVHELTDISPPV